MKLRTFTSEDQDMFAQLSGDYNPIHMDAVAARRYLFGSPIVHGIHSLFWGLDSWLEGIEGNVDLRVINAVFLKPNRVGEEVSLSLKNVDEGNIRIELLSGRSVETRIDVGWAVSERLNLEGFETHFPPKLQPRALSEHEIENESGVLDLYLNLEAAVKMFPRLMKCVSPLQIAILLGTSRIIGGECPGLRSLYSELRLSATQSREIKGLKYQVTQFDKRFRLVSMEITAPGMTGVIKAFVRPAPQGQDSYSMLKTLVSSDEFAEQRALIVGGSRGLGEVSAKLLAAGGATVKITYQRGREDACRVEEEIVSGGGLAQSLFFDVLGDQTNLSDCLENGWNPTHLYYFATPFIAQGTKGVFSPSLFRKFCDYYVVGLQRIFDQLSASGLHGVFYPSSVFVEELPPNMGEFAAAKMAGEALCAFLEKNRQGVVFYRPRLPKMATDQVASIRPAKEANPASSILDHLRSFRDTSVVIG